VAKKPEKGRRSRVVKVIPSGVPELYPDVKIYDTTLEKIRAKHPEEYARLQEIYQTIQAPTRVHKSKTNPRSITLLNSNATSAAGDPLRVPVKIVSDTSAIMTSAYFTEVNDQGPLLWPISSDKTD